MNTRGRLFGKNVLEGVFRAAPDEDLFLGELLVAVDDATGRRYLFRIVDVTYGTEHREPGWAERVAGTLLVDDIRGQAGMHRLHEQSRRTYRVASCRCLGKSNLMMVLAGDVMRAAGRYGLLVVDPHGEYRSQLARHPWAGERLRTYAARSLPNTSSLRVGLAELTVDDLRTAYDWTRPQEEALFELERRFSGSAAGGDGLSWLLDFSHVDDLPGFREVEL